MPTRELRINNSPVTHLKDPAPGHHLERDPTTNRPAAALVKGVCRDAHDAPRRKMMGIATSTWQKIAGNSSSASPDNVVAMRGSLKVPNDNKVRVAVAEAAPQCHEISVDKKSSVVEWASQNFDMRAYGAVSPFSELGAGHAAETLRVGGERAPIQNPTAPTAKHEPPKDQTRRHERKPQYWHQAYPSGDHHDLPNQVSSQENEKMRSYDSRLGLCACYREGGLDHADDAVESVSCRGARDPYSAPK
ncbi:hypothetical protein BJY52DRAFT_1221461 [Lactarius psammicola]|nr:hypothetical protein BJY52DRAFT_1221461 [Lactarius psammicola]